MTETFERVTERRGKVEVPIKHLYGRQYQTGGGDWRTIYYAIFTDWKGKRRKFPLGRRDQGGQGRACALRGQERQARGLRRRQGAPAGIITAAADFPHVPDIANRLTSKSDLVVIGGRFLKVSKSIGRPFLTAARIAKLNATHAVGAAVSVVNAVIDGTLRFGMCFLFRPGPLIAEV